MDGMIIPTGSIDSFTGALSTYFFAPIVNTLFQVQALELFAVFAAVAVMAYVVHKLLPGIIHRGHKDSYIAGFEKGFSSGTEDIDDMPLSAFSAQGVADAAAGKAALAAGASVDESAKVRAAPVYGSPEYRKMASSWDYPMAPNSGERDMIWSHRNKYGKVQGGYNPDAPF